MGNLCASGDPAEQTEENGEAGPDNGTNDPNSSADENGSAKPPAKTSSNNDSNKPSSKQNPIGTVLGRPMEDIKQTYNIGKELGRGQFGVTHLCTHKVSGEQFACKSIAKRKLANKEDIEDVRREVQIMHHLTGQSNIVELKGAYEDKHSVHLGPQA
ncbi:hypothetical protein V6N13_002137 [Hibiscus sabdariffa]